MNDDRGYGAMPKLYGAPAYARPPVLPVNPTERPFDPDDLPLEAERAGEDLAAAAPVEPHPYERAAAPLPHPEGGEGSGKLLGRPFRLRLPGRGRGDHDPSVGE